VQSPIVITQPTRSHQPDTTITRRVCLHIS